MTISPARFACRRNWLRDLLGRFDVWSLRVGVSIMVLAGGRSRDIDRLDRHQGLAWLSTDVAAGAQLTTAETCVELALDAYRARTGWFVALRLHVRVMARNEHAHDVTASR